MPYKSKKQMAWAHTEEGMKALGKKKVAEYDHYIPGYYDRKKMITDIAIHLQIAEMAKNQVLKWQLKLTLQHIYLRAQLNNYSLDRMTAAGDEHHSLVAKMKDKDVPGSLEVMRNHIHNDRTHVIACISGDLDENEDPFL